MFISTQEGSVPRGDYRAVGEVHLSEEGLPWFMHRVALNKLRLDRPVGETPRPVIFTSPITFELTHGHFKWGHSGFHTFASKVVTDDLNCSTVDHWMLEAWIANPSWLPNRNRDALEACLPEFKASSAINKRERVLEKAALIPIESFGEVVVMSVNLQLVALGRLRLLIQEHGRIQW